MCGKRVHLSDVGERIDEVKAFLPILLPFLPLRCAAAAAAAVDCTGLLQWAEGAPHVRERSPLLHTYSIDQQ